jgi:hypothetical protein
LNSEWWYVFVIHPLKEQNIINNFDLEKKPINRLVTEWLMYKESKELESAISWFDTTIKDIESKHKGTTSMTVNGKTHQLKKESSEFFIHNEMVKTFGEDPFMIGKTIVRPPPLGKSPFSKGNWKKESIERI